MIDSTKEEAVGRSPKKVPVEYEPFAERKRVAVDGRHARAERTQRAVTQGMLDCLEAGAIHPTARDVAEKAGVSVRAVFRHFDHLEILFAAVCELQYGRVLRSLRRVKSEGPLESRVVAFVVQQSRLNDRISSVRRAAQRYEAISPAIGRCNDRLRQRDRDEIARVFERELETFDPAEARERVRAIAATVSWTYWEELRRHGNVAAPRARRILERDVHGVLSQN